MTNPFSNIEIQLVRSALTTKTDSEIAELLERTEPEVFELINEITGGGAEARGIRIEEARAAVRMIEHQKEEARRKAEALKKMQKESRERNRKPKKRTDGEIREMEKRTNADIIAQQVKKRSQQYLEKQSFKTRNVDYGNWDVMKTVQVAKGTYVVVRKEVSDREATNKYYENRDNVKNSLEMKEVVKKIGSKVK